MGKLKGKESKIVIEGKADLKPACSSDQYPSFSFRYLTQSRKYNLYGLEPGRAREEIYDALTRKLGEISSRSWLDWGQLRREKGFETIPYGQIRFQANDASLLSSDSKIIVFRFNSDNMRILGYKKSPCAVFYIIGFDFDFSAYDHG